MYGIGGSSIDKVFPMQVCGPLRCIPRIHVKILQPGMLVCVAYSNTGRNLGFRGQPASPDGYCEIFSKMNQKSNKNNMDSS